MKDARFGSLERLIGELKDSCNRYKNGICQTTACLKRGGYKCGDKPNYEDATCERREQAEAIEMLLHNLGEK